MEPIKDLAIVLRSTQYEERHRIITALTLNRGQVSAIAKNSVQSRRFGGSLDIFAASDWMMTLKAGAELHHLLETHLRNSFEELRTDFTRLSLASVFNELMIKLAPKNEPCPDLFRLHSNALSTLSLLKETQREIPLLNTYLVKVLQWSGNQPRIHSCFLCQTPLSEIPLETELSCLIADAGWICEKCRYQETRHIRERAGNLFQHTLLRITPASLWDFHLCLQLPIRQAPLHFKATLEEHKALFKFIEALYVYHIPGFDQKPINSLRFLGLESTLQPVKVNLL